MSDRKPDDAVAGLRRLAELAGRAADEMSEGISRYGDWAIETLGEGGRLLFCGNGGSASTVEHVAAEYVVRFRRRRRPLPAIALTAGSAGLTAAANDFGYEEVFVRALEAHARPGDLLIVHSTSGTSPNCLAAAGTAGELRVRCVALTGASGGSLAEIADLALRVPAEETAAIQEIHLAIEHAVADRVDAYFAEEARTSGQKQGRTS